MRRNEREKLERGIRDALKRQSGALEQIFKEEPERGELFRRRVRCRIEEETKMKRRISFKKVALTAAALCVLGSAVVLASGGFVSTTVSSSTEEQVESYEKLSSLKETYQIPFEIRGPKTFKNGYTFASAEPMHASVTDEAGNHTELPTQICIDYEKEGAGMISLYEESSLMEEDRTGMAEHQREGRTYYFKKDHYRFVPADYEVTEEELAAQEAGELYISYGSETVTDSWISHVSWDEGGVLYQLQAFDTQLTEEELVDMAAEVME